jgi:Mg-chelatase subunit ChlD/tetratricopeptide (TPR) repeat protein
VQGAGAPGAWSGSLAVVDRAASDGASGVDIAPAEGGAFAPTSRGGAVTPGSRLRTDERTRAEIALADGTRIHLDHATEIKLGTSGRDLVMARGNLVADVAHLESGPNATFETPSGRVEVLGTRFALSATDKHTSVRVVRGVVRLRAGDRTVEVRAGEEGTVEAGGAPEVSAAGDLVSAIGWSEILAPDQPEDEVPAGIGELRAYKPGEKRDRDWRLSLASHKVTVRIVGNVARTEIEETFQNDSAVRLEGVYKFPLPPDARIERLALDVDGKMEEGAFVARERASKIWRGVIRKATPRPQIATDDIVWVPGPWRDPALLEWQRGGRFELRIFPIPARGARTVQLAYTQVLPPQGGERRYVYPLPHRADKTPAAKQFDLDIRLAGADPAVEPRVQNYGLEQSRDGDAYRYTLKAANFLPRGDLVVEYSQPDRGAELRAWSYAGAAAAAPTMAASKRGGADPAVVEAQKVVAADQRGTALIALRPVLPRWTEARERDYVIVLDSSQSMVGERFTRARRLAAALVGEMDRRDRFAVLACDIDCKSFAEQAQAPSAATAKRLAAWLDELQPAGASDVVAGLDRAAHLLDRDRSDDRDVWVLYVGDGMPSVGYRRMADLRAESAAIAGRARVSISTVGIGGDADTSALATLARAGGGHYMPYVPGQRAELAALSILETTFGVSLKNPVVELPAGLDEVSPAELPTLRAGQEMLVAARLSGPVKGDVVLRGTVGGKKYENRFPLTLAPSSARGNAFVPRLWAALTIERLELEGRGEDQARIIALSQAYAVLSRHTSLLVLESPAMFKAFGVDRSRPAVEWTGDEDADAVESVGTTDFGAKNVASLHGGGAGNGRASSASTATMAAGEEDEGRLLMDLMDKPAESKPAAAEKSERTKDAKGKSAPAKKAPASRPIPPPRDDGRRWVQMRREWFRVGSVDRFDGVHRNILDAVSRAETQLRLEPNSRERHRALVQALAYAGDLERAHTVAGQWLERDRLDPEALGYMADVLARMGRRDDSIRTLSGAVDLQPDDRALHERLAAAFERVGAADHACAHRITLAAILPADAAIAGRAVRCQRALGRIDGADRLLLSAADATARQKIELAAAEPPSTERTTGDLILRASWSGSTDLDISLIAPDGKRISWLGGRRGVTADGAGRPGSEAIALRRIPAGNYLVEIARTDPADRTPVAGSVHVRVLGVDRELRFDLASDHATVGRIAVTRKSRLVPL